MSLIGGRRVVLDRFGGAGGDATGAMSLAVSPWTVSVSHRPTWLQWKPTTR